MTQPTTEEMFAIVNAAESRMDKESAEAGIFLFCKHNGLDCGFEFEQFWTRDGEMHEYFNYAEYAYDALAEHFGKECYKGERERMTLDEQIDWDCEQFDRLNP
jgi:hypothetical protein